MVTEALLVTVPNPDEIKTYTYLIRMTDEPK